MKIENKIVEEGSVTLTLEEILRFSGHGKIEKRDWTKIVLKYPPSAKVEPADPSDRNEMVVQAFERGVFSLTICYRREKEKV